MGQEHSVTSEIRKSGFVFLPALEAHRLSVEVVAGLGHPLALGKGAAVHTLAPRDSCEAGPNTYSGLFGLCGFPYHTDMAHWRKPPRYLLLRCIVGYAEVPTPLVDGLALAEAVGRDTLKRSLVRPRRRVAGSMSLLRLLEEQGDDGMLVRWDQTFIQPASDAGVRGYALFRDALVEAPSISVSLVERGDTLILDNWRMLHGRAPVPDACKNRLLERAYLERVH